MLPASTPQGGRDTQASKAQNKDPASLNDDQGFGIKGTRASMATGPAAVKRQRPPHDCCVLPCLEHGPGHPAGAPPARSGPAWVWEFGGALHKVHVCIILCVS